MGRPFYENHGGRKIYQCKSCQVYLTNQKEMVSPHFRGATGAAYLFTNVANIKHGEMQQRNMMTGKHYVRDVHCKACDSKLGWMYEFAVDEEQQYKEGKVILEKNLINEVHTQSYQPASPPDSLSSESMSASLALSMTVLNPTKAKKSSHRDKSERNRNAINAGQNTVNEVSSHVSHPSVPAELKKSSFGTSSKTATDNKKTAKKITFEKQTVSNKQCASKPGCSGQSCSKLGCNGLTSLKPGCSGLNSTKPPSYHQSSPQYINTKEEDEAEACNSDDEYGSGFLNNELESLFAQRLYDVRGFQIKEVKGDGACMFRAVAAQVYGDEEKHMDVRHSCIEYIARNREHFSQFITEDFDAYLIRKRQAEVHGNHVELQAISEIYGRQIEIYEYDTKPVITFHPITVEANAIGEHPPLMLSYHGNIHYNSVTDPFRPVNAPINPVVFPNLNTNMHERISCKNAVNASELTHIEEQMLNDKLKMTDYEGTEDELTKQITKESYMDYVRGTLNNAPSPTPPPKVSLYEELLASTAFDDDDETQSLAQAFALSQQEYFNNLR